MKILVTGAAGFIGSHTVDLLLAKGHAVLGVDNFRTGKEENLDGARRHKNFSFRTADVADEKVFPRIVAEFRPEAIIHLAALVSVPESIAHPAENHRLNFHATEVVRDAAIVSGVQRIVFASSAAVYGANPALPLVETANCQPLSPYGQAKLDSERLLLAQALPFVARCHRYFNVYGPRQDPSSPYSGVISRFVDALASGRPPTIHGDGEQSRDFIYVGDVATANLIAATKPDLRSGVANICTGQTITLNRLHRELCAAAKVPRSVPTYGPTRPGDIRYSCGSPAEAVRALGFHAQTPLSSGLRQLLAVST